MPNSGHRWTPEEERDALAMSWGTFSIFYPAISYDAFRVRKGRLIAAKASAPKRGRIRGLIHRAICRD